MGRKEVNVRNEVCLCESGVPSRVCWLQGQACWEIRVCLFGGRACVFAEDGCACLMIALFMNGKALFIVGREAEDADGFSRRY